MTLGVKVHLAQDDTQGRINQYAKFLKNLLQKGTFCDIIMMYCYVQQIELLFYITITPEKRTS